MALKNIASRIKARMQEHRAMRNVAQLDAHILRDIGLNPDKVAGFNPYSVASHRLMGGR